MSTLGRYHEYIGGIWVHRGIPWVHWGDIMSTSGDVQYIEGIWWAHREMFSTLGFSIEIERLLSTCSPTCIMICPWCTEYPPMYSWYPPNVLMVSPNVLMVSPACIMISPDVLMISPDVLMVSPKYSWYPHMHRDIPPDVLNTHYTGWEGCDRRKCVLIVCSLKWSAYCWGFRGM